MPQKYKPVIVVDAGNVLVDIDPNAALQELSERSGREIRLPLPGKLERLFSQVYVGKYSWEAILPAINSTLGLSLRMEEWRELWCRIIKAEVPGMRQVLSEFKKDFRLVALSNTDEMHWKYLVQIYPIFALLDGWVVSFEEGVVKPDPAIYSAVVYRHCNGRLPFFYADDVPEYVEVARNLGWQAEIFCNAAQLRDEIKKRCIAPLQSPV